MLNTEQLEIIKSKPKEFLSQYKALTIRLKKIINELSFEEETVKSETKTKALIAEAINIKKQRDEMYNLINEKLTDDTYRYILCAHYLQNKTISDISIDLNFNKRWIYRLQDKALQALANAI